MNKNIGELVNGLNYFIREVELSDIAIEKININLIAWSELLNISIHSEKLNAIYNEVNKLCLPDTKLVNIDDLKSVMTKYGLQINN